MKKLFTLCIALISLNLNATVHTVSVGGGTFTPNNQTAVVGDTIRWVATGSNHNTVDMGNAPQSLPAGAASWSSGIIPVGSTFDYVVTVAGNYTYQCTVHGFTGTLTVSQNTGIGTLAAPVNHLDIVTSVTNSNAEIKYFIPADGKVNVSIYDLTGRTIATVTDRELSRGEYSNIWDASSAQQGTYLCRLESKDLVLTRKFIIRK